MWTVSWEAQSQENKDKRTKERKQGAKYVNIYLNVFKSVERLTLVFSLLFTPVHMHSVFWYFLSPAAVDTTCVSWRDMILAAQFLIGCLLPSLQQQQANTAPFHTEQT